MELQYLVPDFLELIRDLQSCYSFAEDPPPVSCPYLGLEFVAENWGNVRWFELLFPYHIVIHFYSWEVVA